MPRIALQRLDAHPANANRMPEPLFQKLVNHIRETGQYPPIIVRPIGSDGERYQILDGHHRVKALAQLGMAEANCDVWHADDQRALLLLLTLNRLQGSDDPLKRAALLAELALAHDLKSLEARLPENKEQIERLLALCDPMPPIAEPAALADMPHAVTFFLSGMQLAALNRKLRDVHRDRSRALVALLGLNETCERPGEPS